MKTYTKETKSNNDEQDNRKKILSPKMLKMEQEPIQIKVETPKKEESPPPVTRKIPKRMRFIKEGEY